MADDVAATSRRRIRRHRSRAVGERQQWRGRGEETAKHRCIGTVRFVVDQT